VFAAFVAAALAWRTWLALRQTRHVRAHRDSVPVEFTGFVPIEAHRKAADYTLDKQRIGVVETVVVEGVLLLALTLGGGVAAIDRVAAELFGSGHARDLATVFGVMLATTLVGCPSTSPRSGSRW